MITAKERSKLNGMGMKLSALVHIGKNGLTEGVTKEIDTILTDKELVKLSILKNCPHTVDEICEQLEDLLAVDTVSRVGEKIVIYRRSDKDGVVHVL